MLLVNETLVRLRAEGLTVAEWGLGGSLRGVGLLDKTRPGLHAFVTDDASGEHEAVLCIGWDAPATSADASTLIEGAIAASERRLVVDVGGDDTFALSGTLEDVVGLAKAFVNEARRPFCEKCRRPNDDAGPCGPCVNCGAPICAHAVCGGPI